MTLNQNNSIKATPRPTLFPNLKTGMIRSRLKSLPYFLSLTLLLVSCQSASETEVPSSASESSVSESSVSDPSFYYDTDFTRAEAYLEEYFELTFSSALVSCQEFLSALEVIGVEKLESITTPFTYADATKLAVQGANLEALALTYSRNQSEKAIARLNFYGVDGIEENLAAYVACALDGNLVPATADFSAKLSKTQAEQLLYQVAELRGMARNYLGQINDPDILGKVLQFYHSFADIDRFSGEELKEMGNNLVSHGISTGYGLKYKQYDGNFLTDYLISYSHSDITHVLQILTLLDSEGINGYVQLEPKISSFEYLPEWGEPTEILPTPLYQVLAIEDKWFTFAMEFDLLLEFSTKEDKVIFDQLIEEYAKKWSENQEEDGSFSPSLLEGAWWQPLYLSTTPMENSMTFFPMIEHTISSSDGYSLQIFALEDETLSYFTHLSNNFPLEQYKIIAEEREVNAAFYRYLQGEFE